MCVKQMFRISSLLAVGKDGRPQTFFDGGSIDDIKIKYPPPRFIIQRIPCGSCVECRIQKAQEWAFRCMMEAKEYEHNVMINLTYDDENLPKGVKIDQETGEIDNSYTLCKKDVQDFLKRLRIYWKRHYKHEKVVDEETGEIINPGIRYYMGGEYGSDKEYIDWKGNKRQATKRPHYHMIMFNLPVEDMEFWKMSKCEFSKEKNPIYRSKIIEKLWGKGDVTLNEVNYETCCYVARYVMKKVKGKHAQEYYELQGLEPEYNAMSTNPGIGYKFFERNKEKIENEETFWQRTKSGIKEVKMPRYFDKLIEAEKPELMKEIKEKRLEKSKQYWKNLSEKTDISQSEYIDNRESKLKGKYKKLVRVLK